MASSRRIIVCVVTLLNVNVCFGVDCSLPKIEGNINWDMLPGRWFQTLNTRDVAESVVPCYVLANIRSDGNGGGYGELEAITNVTRYSETYAAIAQHWLFHQDGNYRLDAKYKNIQIDKMKSLSKHRITRLSHKVMKETRGFNKVPIAFLTDEAIMMCINNVKHMWVYGRNAHVTDDYVKNVVNVINRVGEGWGKVSLYRAGCSNLQFFDHVI